MTRVFLLTFGFLGVSWYQLSGGADFQPGQNSVEMMASYTPNMRPDPDGPAQVVAQVSPVVSTRQSVVVARSDTGPALNQIVRPAVQAPFAAAAPLADFSKIRPLLRPTQAAPTGAQVAALDGAVVQSDALPAPVLPEPVLAAVEAAIAAPVLIDYRKVTGSRVNLRGGPGTSYDVVTQLLAGEETEVLDETGDGWVKLRALDGGDIGWMSDQFLARVE